MGGGPSKSNTGNTGITDNTGITVGGDNIIGGTKEMCMMASPMAQEGPWKEMDWSNNNELLSQVMNFKPVTASHVRILLYGPSRAGKSAFINSLAAAVGEKRANVAEDKTNGGLQYKAYKFLDVPIVFNEITGLESGVSDGAFAEDIKLALEGHVKDGHIFDSNVKMTNKDENYQPDPTVDDKVHVLVYVLNANEPNIDETVIQRMKEIKKTADDLGIPVVAVGTHIDELSGDVEHDAKNALKSSALREKMELFSSEMGMSSAQIFPVRNNYGGPQNSAVSTLLMTALKYILDVAVEYLKKHFS